MTTPRVEAFFDQYERSRSTLDLTLIASQYSDCFMSAGPAGARVVEKSAVLAAFPKGQEFLRAVGHESTRVVSVDETTLDEHYVLARVQFLWRFARASAPPVEVPVDSTFILFVDHGVLRIVFQQEREDFQQALRSRGVLPA